MHPRLAKRILIGLFAIAALVLGYQYLRQLGEDPDFGTANTSEAIAAIELLDDGSRAVLFDAQGNKVPSPGYQAPAADREVVWRPDGNRLFVVSNREGKGFQIFRWNPGAESIELRSVGTRNVAGLWFPPEATQDSTVSGLVTAGGFVLEYAPREATLRQILPPTSGEGARGEDGGVVGQFDSVYQGIGQSFRLAKWTQDREWIVATMRREQGGEVLVAQQMTPVQNPQTGVSAVPPPAVLAAGERIDFDVAATGAVVYSVQSFRFPDPQRVPPEFIKDGKVVPPYRHALVTLQLGQPEAPPKILFAGTNNEQVTANPRFSPNGADVLVEAGTFDPSAGFQSVRLIVLSTAGEGQVTPLAIGAREASWHPGGQKVVYVRSEGGRRLIFTANRDGTGEQRVLGASGNYRFPTFSPQSGRAPQG